MSDLRTELEQKAATYRRMAGEAIDEQTREWMGAIARTLTDLLARHAPEPTAEDDGPKCETCGKTTCPDAQLPQFSAPAACVLAPIFEAVRYAKDCDYGCSRDLSNQTVRLYVAPVIARIANEAKAKGAREALLNFADSTRFPSDWILFRRDDGSGVTVPDLLRETADRIGSVES